MLNSNKQFLSLSRVLALYWGIMLLQQNLELLPITKCLHSRSNPLSRKVNFTYILPRDRKDLTDWLNITAINIKERV